MHQWSSLLAAHRNCQNFGVTTTILHLIMYRIIYRPAKPLKILQINVGRGATLYKLALSLANDSFINIILIQELYIFTDCTRRITKFHPMYKTFTPLNNWQICPWVILYIRKSAGLTTAQLWPCTSRDLIFLQIQARNTTPLSIVNTYNAPIGSTNAGAAVNNLLGLPAALWQFAFIAGNFNLHHLNWNSDYLLLLQ